MCCVSALTLYVNLWEVGVLDGRNRIGLVSYLHNESFYRALKFGSRPRENIRQDNLSPCVSKFVQLSRGPISVCKKDMGE